MDDELARLPCAQRPTRSAGRWGAARSTPGPVGDSYIPADGTAIAAAHITGLAALLLAHHDHLRTQAHPRTPARTSQLYTLLRAACRPVPGTDPARTGAGLADAPTALGIRTAWQYGTVAAQPHTAAHTPCPAHPSAPAPGTETPDGTNPAGQGPAPASCVPATMRAPGRQPASTHTTARRGR
ncbi:hypothetical protein [Streptomyces sp. NPDC056480]|uniref:hypothetical protein n=1 Tax=Streptomyces sp. NPDC056480 TaxID=3345833 RepID=UPI0036C806E0